MKKVMLTLVMLMMVTAGCQEETNQAPGVKPISSWVLPKTAEQEVEFAKWKEVYGDNEKTLMHYNIAVLSKIIDQHGRIINTNSGLIFMTLTDTDPNSVASVTVSNREQISDIRSQISEIRDQMSDDKEQMAGNVMEETVPAALTLDDIEENITLKSLEEHDAEAMAIADSMNNPQLNGIACPKCGSELLDTAPHFMLLSNPPQYYIACSNTECDYTGTRF
jgi:hypothetical protein